MLRKKERQLFDDYRHVFGSDAGKRVLADLMDRFHMLTPTFDHENTNTTLHNEGERNAVLYILWRLKFKEEEFRHQIQEQE